MQLLERFEASSAASVESRVDHLNRLLVLMTLDVSRSLVNLNLSWIIRTFY